MGLDITDFLEIIGRDRFDRSPSDRITVQSLRLESVERLFSAEKFRKSPVKKNVSIGPVNPKKWRTRPT